MSGALRELLERACEAYLYSQMRNDRFTAAEWMSDAFNAAGIPAILAKSAAYDALVAEIAGAVGAEVCMVRHVAGSNASIYVTADPTRIAELVGQRVRLLPDPNPARQIGGGD